MDGNFALFRTGEQEYYASAMPFGRAGAQGGFKP
jgi:hypothetical protein